MKYRPVSYGCGDGVTIRLCPEEWIAGKLHPEFWFIRRDLHSWDNLELYRAGFRTLYWSLIGWKTSVPIQFPTAEAAIEYHREHELNMKEATK